jgi:hypothetical protein
VRPILFLGCWTVYKLKTLPEKLFLDQTSLEILSLKRNPIESLSGNVFSKLGNLKEIDMSYVNLETIPNKIFKNNGNLTELILDGKIAKMSNKMFSHLRKLRTLDLRFNYCKSLLIQDHNLTIGFTEEILIPCSCSVLMEKKSDFHTKALFIFLGIVAAIILFIFVLILIKMMRQKNFQSREFFLVFKNGE